MINYIEKVPIEEVAIKNQLKDKVWELPSFNHLNLKNKKSINFILLLKFIYNF